MGFEQQLQQGLFNQNSEKSFIDKLLSKEDSNRIKELIKKEYLERSELLELLYLLNGTESKLLNYGAWDRYIINKYFVWIREFIKICEGLYDYKDDLKKKEKDRKIIISKRTEKLIQNIDRNLQHAAKFNIDLFFGISRSTLSLGATGFIEMLKNKFEISYPDGNPSLTPLPQPQQKKMGFFK